MTRSIDGSRWLCSRETRTSSRGVDLGEDLGAHARRRAGRARGGPRGSAGTGPARRRRGRAPAGCAVAARRGGRSITWTLATRAVSGERSSWPTSAANRASRWIRSSRASTMLLNEPTMVARSGSSVGGSRVCRSPAPIRAAAVATSSSGAISRREASRPSAAPARVGEEREGGEHHGERGRAWRAARSSRRSRRTPRRRPGSGTPTTRAGWSSAVVHANVTAPPTTPSRTSVGMVCGSAGEGGGVPPVVPADDELGVGRAR